MKVLIAASEIATLAQTGGLADVMRSLPIALKRIGVDVALIMPKYQQVEIESEFLGDVQIPIEEKPITGHIHRGTLPDTDVPVFLVEQEHYFDREQLYTDRGRDYPDNLERFTFFNRAVLDVIARGYWQTDVLHANDWQTALLPTYLKTTFKDHAVLGKIKTLFTIHNLAFQGLFPVFFYPVIGLGWEHFNLGELEFYNQVNLLKGGIIYSDAINTVSPTYAKEIQTKEFGYGLEGLLQERSDRLTGILNRVDDSQWSPNADKHLDFTYDENTFSKGKEKNKKALLEEFALPFPQSRKPLFGVVTRLTYQKGCDLISAILPSLVRRDAQIVVLGTGDPKIENTLRALEKQYPKSFGLRVAFDTKLSHLIEAGSDIFLMPSRFEPCGLNQMYSLRYGSIPIVRSIGGLADTVIDVDESPDGNGFFVFRRIAGSAAGSLRTSDRSLRETREMARINEKSHANRSFVGSIRAGILKTVPISIDVRSRTNRKTVSTRYSENDRFSSTLGRHETILRIGRKRGNKRCPKPIPSSYTCYGISINPGTSRRVRNNASCPGCDCTASKIITISRGLSREFDGWKQTINLVPSLLDQIQGYVDGEITDESWELSQKPAASLTEEEKKTNSSAVSSTRTRLG